MLYLCVSEHIGPPKNEAFEIRFTIGKIYDFDKCEHVWECKSTNIGTTTIISGKVFTYMFKSVSEIRNEKLNILMS